MPIERLETVLAAEVASLTERGTAKGAEHVVRAVIPATGNQGPRYLLEGAGDRPFLRMNSNSYLGLALREDIAEAEEQVETVTAAEAIVLQADNDVMIVDLRDIRERMREGFVGGSLHVPRGMLEFWIDPETPYYKEVFGSGKRFVLYCQVGWRSALAASSSGSTLIATLRRSLVSSAAYTSPMPPDPMRRRIV